MGMRHWERRTCVQFVAKNDKKKTTCGLHSIQALNNTRAPPHPRCRCWSFIGKQGGEQILSVGFTCNTMRTVVHEIGHAVGLWHEQSRRDRDKYIKVVKANIAPGAAENFQKIDIENITSLGYPYDFDSVMHYDALAFTKNGAPTMKVRKEYRDIPSTELGMKDRLSDLDIAQVNAMYECNQKKPLSEECFQSEAGKGEEYRGDINYTDDFITCQKWTAQWPHKHEQYSSKPRKNERNGLGEHNYCRNPDSKRKKPWCFTNHKKIRWQYCPIKLC
ncbi:putative zinc metalloproteinase nas-13-like [Apostichopus japonicus]|uniref:Metalloendopeptidase n=1 Tax=Stichopus japonicus TaxID=307972 RepID=A0A2G8JHS8_STIJA|nr:putative zinc metalloproteinase nas-13-like [Apostichopus japonicus]